MMYLAPFFICTKIVVKIICMVLISDLVPINDVIISLLEELFCHG